MPKGVATGYVWGIKDPRLTAEDKPDVVYVGNGQRPWESVRRHIQESSNMELFEWSKDLFKDFPEGVEVLGKEVCDKWHGEPVEIPPPVEGRTRLEWVIFGEEQNDDLLPKDPGSERQVLPLGTLKSHIIKKLRAEGHPLLNRPAGRPPKRSSE